jgi:hypothetical protein
MPGSRSDQQSRRGAPFMIGFELAEGGIDRTFDAPLSEVGK